MRGMPEGEGINMNYAENKAMLSGEACGRLFAELYEHGASENRARYEAVLDGYVQSFGDGEIFLFTSAGRTEIAGNHTDHNHGKVLAGSINLDCVAAAGKNGRNEIRIISESFAQDFVIALDNLEPSPRYAGTVDLTKGILRAFTESGCHVGGFNAYITSNVIASAGVSSSASYEMLICSVLNELFNDGKLDLVSYAHMGQYAENQYWKKASGLMDQMACAVGGLISLDFRDPKEPAVEKLAFDFAKTGYSMVMVQTGKGHADLSEEYSSIPNEMKKVARSLGGETLADCSEESLIARLPEIRTLCGDRACMRAFHFFEENRRVSEAVAALSAGDFQKALSYITESGNSSWKYLQNTYVTGAVAEQGIPIALALTEIYLKRSGKGACRVNGGGFAGVIQTFLPESETEDYVRYMDGALGTGSAHVMKIRPIGAACVNRLCG